MNPNPGNVPDALASAPPASDPLAGLRSYHLPEPPSWWPPAPGWWLLGLLVLIVAALSIWWYRRRRRRLAAARQAKRELALLRERFAQQDDAAVYARELSKLLRRYALVAFPHRDVAALTGEEWLRFLDRYDTAHRFSDGPGRQLLDAPYRPAALSKPEELAALIEDWIHHNREVAA